jgi:predicted PhzF superfamily epimerase YddE/YHI9
MVEKPNRRNQRWFAVVCFFYASVLTSPGQEADFVSRHFAPKSGIPEDPVTGSAHTTLIPYWSRKLGKPQLQARQISKRGGELLCKDLGDRVEISGRAVTYLVGEVFLSG